MRDKVSGVDEKGVAVVILRGWVKRSQFEMSEEEMTLVPPRFQV